MSPETYKVKAATKPVTVYVDGFNLYHAIENLKKNHLKWLNLAGLARSFIRQEEHIWKVYVFTALTFSDEEKKQRHRALKGTHRGTRWGGVVIRMTPDRMAEFRAAIEAAGLGAPATIIADGRLHRFATSVRRGDDAGWYVLHAEPVPAGAFGDWRSGLSLTWRAGRPQRETLTSGRRQAITVRKVEDRSRTDAAMRVWRAADLVRGTLVETYLAARGIRMAVPDSLRFHSALPHPCGGTWPAMLALVTNGRDGTPMAVHRTFMARDGSGKAPVWPGRMMLGPCSGGAVRLAEAGDVTMIGEGIETCLAAMQAGNLPAWAALSTSGLRSLDMPEGMRDVIVLADGDLAGEAAAEAAALRWKRQERRVRIARAPQGMDFNDVLLARGVADEAGAP